MFDCYFPFFLSTPIFSWLIADTRFFTRCCLLARSLSSWFRFSSLLAPTPCLHARFWTRLSPQGYRPVRPVNGGGVPSVPELCFVLVSLRPLGGFPHRYLLRVFSCLFSGYLFVFFFSCGVCTCFFCLPFALSETLFRHTFFVLGCVTFFLSITASAMRLMNVSVFVSVSLHSPDGSASTFWSSLVSSGKLLLLLLPVAILFANSYTHTCYLHARLWTRLCPQGHWSVRPVNGVASLRSPS